MKEKETNNTVVGSNEQHSDTNTEDSSEKELGIDLPRRTVISGIGSLGIGTTIGGVASKRVRGDTTNEKCNGRGMVFIERLHNTRTAFKMNDWFVWGSDVIKADDGTYHMFASRFPFDKPFYDSYGNESEIVRATSKTPEGPYTFQEVVQEVWAHNPAITRAHDGTYLLYWQDGDTFLSTADSPTGPWTTRQIIPGASNSAPVVRDDGSVVVGVKNFKVPDITQLDIYVAPHYEGPYELASTQPFDIPPDGVIEDPAIWQEDGFFHYVSNRGSTAGYTETEGFYAVSGNGIDWHIPERAEAFPRDITFTEDNEGYQGVTDIGDRERPKLLVEDGKATHLFNAVAVNDKDERDDELTDDDLTFNAVTPLTVAKGIEIKPDEKTAEIDLRSDENIPVVIRHEEGFDPRSDVDVSSLRFGSIDAVDTGCGAQPVRTSPLGDTTKDPGDLTVHFPNENLGFRETAANFAAKLVGKTTDGELVFGHDRVIIPGPDLTFDEFTVETTGNQTRRFTVTVVNEGTERSPSTVAVLLDVTDDERNRLATFDVPSLGADESTTFTYDWDPSTVPPGQYELQTVVDPNDEVWETTETNNTSPTISVELLNLDPLPEGYETFASTDAVFGSLDGDPVINANGQDVWDGVDEYGAIYKPDVQISDGTSAVVRVVSQENTNEWAKAGLMLRNDITAAGESTGYAIVAATPGNGFSFQYDGDADGYVDENSNTGDVNYPCWLKLERNGDTVTSYYGTDGSTWTELDSAELTGADATQDIAMFSASHTDSERAVVRFDDFMVSSS